VDNDVTGDNEPLVTIGSSVLNSSGAAAHLRASSSLMMEDAYVTLGAGATTVFDHQQQQQAELSTLRDKVRLRYDNDFE